MMKKTIAIILSILIFVQVSVNIYADPDKKEEIPEDLPDKYLVMDSQTGAILFSKSEHEKINPRSLTSIMTSIIMLENGKLQDKIKTSMDFKVPKGTSIAVDIDEEFTLEQLLNAALLVGANDAIKALALSKTKTLEEFASLMNDRAKKLGMNDSNFESPLNSSEKEQVTSLYDISLMAKKAMDFHEFREIVKSKQYVIPPTNRKKVSRDYIKQGNAFIKDGEYYDKNVNGIRVDFTKDNYIILTSVEYEKMSLIFVSEGKDKNTAYKKHKNLMAKAKNEYDVYNLVYKDDKVGKNEVLSDDGDSLEITMIASQNVSVILPKDVDLEKDISRKIEKLDLTDTPIMTGTKLGTLSIGFRGKILSSIDLISEGSLEDAEFLGELSENKEEKTTLQKVIFVLLILLKIIIALVIWVYVVGKRRDRINKKSVSNVTKMNDYKKNRY